jgi:hypothetical protein
MHHAYRYAGAYELNYNDLKPGTTAYKTTEGETRDLRSWPEKVDGVRVSYMEKTGKKFYAVRAQFGPHDVVLENPVAIDPMRHMNNRRFNPDPVIVTDDEASALLDDMIRDNPEKQGDIGALINEINTVRRANRA